MTVEREKWEYCMVSGALAYYEPAQLVFFTSEGRKVEILSGEKLSRDKKIARMQIVAMRITELGNDGWEMVGTGVENVMQHCIYFKRKR